VFLFLKFSKNIRFDTIRFNTIRFDTIRVFLKFERITVDESNQNISVLPIARTKLNLRDDSFETEPSSKSNLLYNKKKVNFYNNYKNI